MSFCRGHSDNGRLMDRATIAKGACSLALKENDGVTVSYETNQQKPVVLISNDLYSRRLGEEEEEKNLSAVKFFHFVWFLFAIVTRTTVRGAIRLTLTARRRMVEEQKGKEGGDWRRAAFGIKNCYTWGHARLSITWSMVVIDNGC